MSVPLPTGLRFSLCSPLCPLCALLVAAAAGPALLAPALGQPTFSDGVLPNGVPDGASGTNVLTEDPLFYDPAGGDYRPDKPAGSPLVDLAGSDAPYEGRLLNGQTQTAGGWDAGALESNGSALPVEWAGLSARWDGEAVHLTWQTASETRNGGFRVERQVDAPAEGSGAGGPESDGGPGNAGGPNADGPDRGWQTVGFVEGAGTTTRAQSYRFVDEEVPFAAEHLRYRLVQVDVGGTTTTSDPIVVERPSPDRIRLDPPAPNPASAETTVRFALPGASGAAEARLLVFDVLGRQVEARPVDVRGGERRAVRLVVADWPAGLYFVRLQAGSETRTERLTVVR